MSNSWFNWPSSLSRFVKFDAARAEEVNNALDEVSTAFDGVEVKTSAAIKLPDGEASSALGNSASRQNKVLTFDGSGNAVTTYAIADVAAVSGIAADVTTVATNIADINDCITNLAAIIDAPNQASAASGSASAAAASAASALTAPGTSATSTSTLTIGEGTQSLTIQTGKSISVGQSVTIARTATPTTRMSGAITAYDSGTGALTVEVDRANGSGTYSAWTVSLGVITIDVALREYVSATGNVEAGFSLVNTSAGAITLTLPASPTTGESYAFEDAAYTWMTNPLTIARNGNTINGVAEDLICNIDGADFVLWFNGTTWRLA